MPDQPRYLTSATETAAKTGRNAPEPRDDVESRDDIDALSRAIAHRLHDHLAHDLTTLVLRAEELRLRPEVPGEIVRELAAIAVAGRRALSDLRYLLEALRRGLPEVARPDLGTELVRLQARLSEAGFGADVVANGDLDHLREPQDRILSGCLVEAINNVITHGRTGTDCVVRIENSESEVELVVINSVDPERPAVQGGLGLAGIRDLVTESGGTVDAGPRPNGLWVLDVSLPNGTLPPG